MLYIYIQRFLKCINYRYKKLRSSTHYWPPELISPTHPSDFHFVPFPTRQITQRLEEKKVSISPSSLWTNLAIIKPSKSFILSSFTGLILSATSLISYHHYKDEFYPESLIRFSRSAWTCAIISADYKFSTWLLIGEERKRQLEVINKRSAYRLLDLFKSQGGIYVKAGQHLSSLNYLVSKEYTNILSELYSKAATRPFYEVRSVLEEDLCTEVNQYFDYIDPIPVAAASIAQVHYAQKDGRDLAVKVQFPDISRLCKSDCQTIRVITDFISFIFPEFQLKWLVREFDANLPLELDFVHEANNARRMQQLFKCDRYLHIPEIYHASKRILVMEWIDGKHILEYRDLEGVKANPSVVTKELNRIFNDQIFKHRFVHCDPHAGNIMIRKATTNPDGIQICLLDNGLYRNYSEEFCLDYAKLWMGILKQDEKTMEESARRMGVLDYRLFVSMITMRSWQSISNQSFYSLINRDEIEQIRSQARSHAADISSILATVPSPLLLLLKTNDLLRVINHELGCSISSTLTSTLLACQPLIQKYSTHDLPLFLLSGGKLSTWISLKLFWEKCKFHVKLWVLKYLFYLRFISHTS